jgi:hypothetical protein
MRQKTSMGRFGLVALQGYARTLPDSRGTKKPAASRRTAGF